MRRKPFPWVCFSWYPKDRWKCAICPHVDQDLKEKHSRKSEGSFLCIFVSLFYLPIFSILRYQDQYLQSTVMLPLVIMENCFYFLITKTFCLIPLKIMIKRITDMSITCLKQIQYLVSTKYMLENILRSKLMYQTSLIQL